MKLKQKLNEIDFAIERLEYDYQALEKQEKAIIAKLDIVSRDLQEVYKEKEELENGTDN